MARASGGIVFVSIFLIASALDGGPKLDVDDQRFSKAELEIKSIMHDSEKKIAPEDDALKGLVTAFQNLEKTPGKPNPADAPKNPRSTENGTFSSISGMQDKAAPTQRYTDKTGPNGALSSASFAQVTDESNEREEEDEAALSEDEEIDGEDAKEEGAEEEDEEEDEDEDDGEKDESGEEGEDEEDDEQNEDEANDREGREGHMEDVNEDDEEEADGTGQEDDEEQAEWVMPHSLDSSGKASFVDDDDGSRKLMSRRSAEEHRRRGVSDMPMPVPPVLEADSSVTTTTTGRYPLGYIGPGHEAVEKHYKDKWAVMPDPEGREMTKAWAFDHPIDYHERSWDGKPGKCDGRRRHSRRRRVCSMSHRRRRHHRRRRSHHRRRSYEYRRRRRRVHRRRRISKDKKHRRRSHRRRLDRGDPAATKKMNQRKAQRAGNGGNDADANEQQRMQGHDGGESLMQRSQLQMDGHKIAAESDMAKDTMAVNAFGNALPSQDQSVLMRRHDFEIG